MWTLFENIVEEGHVCCNKLHQKTVFKCKLQLQLVIKRLVHENIFGWV